MATAILSSRNPLHHRFDHETLIHRKPNSGLTRRSDAAKTAPHRRKSNPKASQSTKLVVSPAANTKLVMGQVKILKRGEALSAFQNKENISCVDRDDEKKRPVSRIKDVDLIVSTTTRIGPEPKIVQKQIGACKGLKIVAGKYAGTGCSVSPPPSSVPIPCFLEKSNLLKED
uniref:Uncharacterized protein n=1 Tax=Noccaea caerulescens TaxID=107243 RepID=A0A1J3FWP8_NOCCA